MSTPYGAQPQEAAGIRAEAAQAGKNDARRSYPRAASSGEAVTDYFGTAAQASAQTAATLHLAGHLHDERPGLDRAIAEATALVVRLTAWVNDLLSRTSAADHEVQAFKRLPLAARREPWPAWLRIVLLSVMALGTGAALSGALLELTSDEPYYVWGFCLATTLAVVALGAFLAHTARSFEYNQLKADQFTTGWLPKAVFGVGVLFAGLLMVALASIRGTAAEADAARQSRTDHRVTVQLPDQPVDVGGQSAPAEAEPPPLPRVSPLAFGLLEGLLFMAAFGVEYVNCLPWADQRKRAEQSLAEVETELSAAAGQLERACARLMGGLDERAACDAAVLLAGEATITHVTAEVSDYRRALLTHHPNLGGDPFQDARRGAEAQAPEQVTNQVAGRWGRDLQPADLIRSDVAYDRLEFDQLAPTVLARGLATLASTPERARFTPLTWRPAGFIEAALSYDGVDTATELGVRARRAGSRSANGRGPANRSSDLPATDGRSRL
jgi:hypothetical protein